MEEFLREVGSGLADEAQNLSVEALGRQMNVAGGPTEAPLPKNVGLLFFNEHPRRFFPTTQIDVIWFPEGAGGDRFDEKIFEGPLARIARDALNYIQANYLKQTVVKHPDRAEAERFWNFPYAAIEEAVVNAVYHHVPWSVILKSCKSPVFWKVLARPRVDTGLSRRNHEYRPGRYGTFIGK